MCRGEIVFRSDQQFIKNLKPIYHLKINTMIKIKDLEKIYRTEEVETVALNKLSLDVKEGEFVAIMGPSGCGKSTLLNILGLLDDPDDGSFQFNGIEVAKFNTVELKASIEIGRA